MVFQKLVRTFEDLRLPRTRRDLFCLPLLVLQLIATACLLLAGKVEENFKSLQKITETAYFVRNKKDPKAAEALRANQVRCATILCVGSQCLCSSVQFPGHLGLTVVEGHRLLLRSVRELPCLETKQRHPLS